MYPPLYLKKSEERRLLAGHLWIYSNEVDNQRSPLKNFQPGELVVVKSNANKFLGVGYVNPHTLLTARLLTRNFDEVIDSNFFSQRISGVLQLREMVFSQPFYRLIFGESDYLPGLIVDRFNDILVVQLNTAGMDNLKEYVVAALVNVLQPKAILWRNDNAMREVEGLAKYVAPAYGEPPLKVYFEENTVKFTADIWQGQKTGWFFDQRNNRKSFTAYIPGKHVLDVFSYCGAFGVQGAVFGAQSVTCIDVSKFALNQVSEHALLNNVANKINLQCGDAFEALRNLKLTKKTFDVIVLDPPAFIKRHKDLQEGYRAYLKLHKLALNLLNADGILFSTSCSQQMSRDMLLDVIRKAGVSCQRSLRILEQLHQAQDHPVHPAIAETNYLKGFVVKIS
jgi:23S rRNA (cytosine1962-C5)-methyltransferase